MNYDGPMGIFEDFEGMEYGSLKFYDEGWNARCRGKPFRSSIKGASRSWRDGWKDCDEAPEHDRKEI